LGTRWDRPAAVYYGELDPCNEKRAKTLGLATLCGWGRMSMACAVEMLKLAGRRIYLSLNYTKDKEAAVIFFLTTCFGVI
jgi:hypothetical protein